jgi:hypothetical protein
LARTTGNQTYNDRVTFGASPSIQSSAGNITFASTANAGRRATAHRNTGSLSLNGAVGA